MTHYIHINQCMYNPILSSHVMVFTDIQRMLHESIWLPSTTRSTRIDHTNVIPQEKLCKCFRFVFFFRPFSSGIVTADFPSPVVSINSILLRHFNLSHVFFHHIHKPPFWPSPFPLSWQVCFRYHVIFTRLDFFYSDESISN